MKTKPNDGGPVFPQQIVFHNGEWIPASALCSKVEGMTMRQYYAGQEVITHEDGASFAVCESLAGPRPEGNWDTNSMEWLLWEARWKAAMKRIRADALIAELEKEAE